MLRLRPGLAALVAGAALCNSARAAAQESPPPAAFASVTAAEYHSCGLTTDGVAYCWGLNVRGELGAESVEQCSWQERQVPCSRRPVAVGGGLRFTALALGALHTCGLTSEGQVYCWGENLAGQLGRDSALKSTTPLPVAEGLRFVSLSAGGLHTCGLTATGIAYCWGRNEVGQLGSDSAADICPGARTRVPCHRTPLPVAGMVTYKSLSAGQYHTCALLTNGTAHCWGREFTRKPGSIPGGYAFVAISAGGARACGLTTDGTPYCWGSFLIGPGVLATQANPTRGGTWPADADTTAWRLVSVSTGQDHICGVTGSGVAYCWGANTFGQLGAGGGLFKKGGSREPVRVAGDLKFAVVSAGFSHTCGVATDGRTLCWGGNSVGQLGDGTTDGHNEPTPIRLGR